MYFLFKSFWYFPIFCFCNKHELLCNQKISKDVYKFMKYLTSKLASDLAWWVSVLRFFSLQIVLESHLLRTSTVCGIKASSGRSCTKPRFTILSLVLLTNLSHTHTFIPCFSRLGGIHRCDLHVLLYVNYVLIKKK